jgi:4-hydroxy-tetrahydrodipicolinate reductase
MIRIAIAGACGRMGQMLIEEVLKASDATLAAAFDMPDHPRLGEDAGALLGKTTGVAISSDAAQALALADMVIDFTRPQATLELLDQAAQRGVKMVIGTTGFDVAEREQIARAAEKTAVVFAPNMGVGVNATLKLLEVAAGILNQGYDIEVIEAHHRHKVDAPSGTALEMGRTIAKVLGVSIEGENHVGVFERHGVTGERETGSIGFSTIRGGDVVGDHTVMFLGTGERIEITHRSNSRATYAVGAVRACRFLAGHRTGLFDMQDVLGLRNIASQNHLG